MRLLRRSCPWLLMVEETIGGQIETLSAAERHYLAGCIDRWCPGLSDSLSDWLSIHHTEFSVLESSPLAFLDETPLLKWSLG